MLKYKEMTYNIRKDGILYKKIEKNKCKYHLYSKNKEDLYKQYIDLKYKLEHNIASQKNNIIFKDYSDQWFDATISGKAYNTQVNVKNRIRHINYYIGYMKMKDVKPTNIQYMVTDMQKKGFKDLVNRTLMDCNRIFDDAIRNDLLEKNPCFGIKKIKYQKEPRKPLTVEEDKKVLELALNHKYGAFILSLRYCGLRPEEGVALDIKDFNPDNKTFYIHSAVEFIHNQPHLKSTKNLRIREMPIPSIIYDKIEDHIKKQISNSCKYVFTKETNNKEMYSKETLKRHLEAFLNDLNKDIILQQKILLKDLKKSNNKEKIEQQIEELENKKITFTYYQLRHSYCTMLYYAGIPIKEAQRLMGDNSSRMVLDIYTHLDETRENSEDKINCYIDKLY